MSNSNLTEEQNRRAEEFRQRYKELRALQVLYELHPEAYRELGLPIPGEVLESICRPNPNGYSTAEIIAISKGNAHMICKRKEK